MLDPADPAVAIAQELAAALAGQVWADLKGAQRGNRGGVGGGGGGGDSSRGGSGMSSRGSGKRLMELAGEAEGDAGVLRAAGAVAEGAQDGGGEVVVGSQKKYQRK